MSATPIPRTLEMAITGIREMSTITTPPEERHPVLTYVGAYEDRQVVAAIRRELLREGQVFYIHNRVQSIEKAAARIRELVPDARVAVGARPDGGAPARAGDARLLGEALRRAGVHDDRRVGARRLQRQHHGHRARRHARSLPAAPAARPGRARSRERAYAYFLYPPEKPLTETAHDRLATLAQHSDLGGGMAIAMKDLEIRGAGNLLGGEQSGHIADVGFDLYVRLVGEAVQEYRAAGRPTTSSARSGSSCPVDAHLPHDYIGSERLRLEMYKRLAEVRADEDVDQLAAELQDRYGAPPDAGHVAAAGRQVPRAGPAGGDRRGHHRREARAVRPGHAARVRRRTPPAAAPGSVVKTQVGTILVPRPQTAVIGGRPIAGVALLEWARQVIDAVIDPPSSTTSKPGAAQPQKETP